MNKVYAVIEEVWNADATKKIGLNVFGIYAKYETAKKIVKINQDNVHAELLIREWVIQ